MRAFSSLLEQESADVPLARDVALTVRDLGFNREAMTLCTRLMRQRPYEPQSIVALASIAGDSGLDALSVVWFEVVMAGSWPARFGSFAQITSFSYSRQLVATGGNAATHAQLIDLDASRIDSSLNTAAFWKDFLVNRRASLIKLSGVSVADIVVIIEWSTDNSDVDLHVFEPNGEECFYAHPSTSSGGKLTQDVTRGFGPEMYMIRDAAKSGLYRLNVQYFGVSSNLLAPQTKVYVTTVVDWGYSTELKNSSSVLLTQRATTVELGSVARSNKETRTPLTVVEAGFATNSSTASSVGISGGSAASTAGSDSSPTAGSPTTTTASYHSSSSYGFATPLSHKYLGCLLLLLLLISILQG